MIFTGQFGSETLLDSHHIQAPHEQRIASTDLGALINSLDPYWPYFNWPSAVAKARLLWPRQIAH